MSMAGITHIAKDSGLNPVRCPNCGQYIDTSAAVAALFKAIMRRVKSGEKVIIKGFGVFSAKLLKGRTLKTPLMEGGEAKFPDAWVLRFHQSNLAKAFLNKDVKPTRKKKKKKSTKKKGARNVK
jgi:nucleoid DNA-binding protein